MVSKFPSAEQTLVAGPTEKVESAYLRINGLHPTFLKQSHIRNTRLSVEFWFKPQAGLLSTGHLFSQIVTPRPSIMGSSDIAPAHVPTWVVPLSTAALGIGVLCWDAAYILMTLRSLKTKSYSMPLLGLALNVSWEIVYALYVCESPLETAGFTIWLILDIGVVYTTIKFAPYEWNRTSPWVGRHTAAILAVMTAVGCAGHFAFVSWWLSAPGIGHGDKSGKWYFGQDEYDTTELAYWSAGTAQLVASVGSLAMLLVRGHSGGTSYKIW